MKLTRLNHIRARQRQYLVFDILLAGLAALMLVLQFSVFSGASVSVADPVPYMAPETIYIYGTAPDVATDIQPGDSVAVAPNTVTQPGT